MQNMRSRRANVDSVIRTAGRMVEEIMENSLGGTGYRNETNPMRSTLKISNLN